MSRTSTITRQTAETKIELELELDGSGDTVIATGIGFFDHMLTLLGRHALFDLKIKAVGDLEVDQHHTVEDVGICLGQALQQALGEKKGITRYGSISLPMEESLVTAAVDLGGRAYFVSNVKIPTDKIGDFDSQLVHEFWKSVTDNGLFNLHLDYRYGDNSHHIAEAVFKGVARALRTAVRIDRSEMGIPSTKGTLD